MKPSRHRSARARNSLSRVTGQPVYSNRRTSAACRQTILHNQRCRLFLIDFLHFAHPAITMPHIPGVSHKRRSSLTTSACFPMLPQSDCVEQTTRSEYADRVFCDSQAAGGLLWTKRAATRSTKKTRPSWTRRRGAVCRAILEHGNGETERADLLQCSPISSLSCGRAPT